MGKRMENVIITGVSGGIGLAVAKQLLSGGSTVTGIDKNLGDSACRLAEEHPSRLHLRECDLSIAEEIPKLVKSIVQDRGPIGGLVHCAGFDKMSPLHMCKARDYEALWRIHALAAMMLVGSIGKRKNYGEGASLVLVSSQSAHEGAMGHAAYAAAKGAIEGFLAPAAAELMEKGIRLNEVCLAPVNTLMAQGWMGRLSDEGRQKLLESYPLGISEPEDAAKLICFLLSKDARFINGQIVTADGGHAVRKV